MNNLKERQEFEEVVLSVGEIFNATKNKRDAFKIWHSITSFLSQLSQKCSEDILMIFGAAVGVKLLAKFITVKHFKDDDDIMKSMLFCLGCVSELAEAIATHKLNGRYNMRIQESESIIYEFIELAATDEIFFADSFEDVTSNILENGIQSASTATILKYCNLIVTMMASNEIDVQTKVFQHSIKLNVQELLSNLVSDVEEVCTQEEKVKILQIQQGLLRYVTFKHFKCCVDFQLLDHCQF